MLDAGVTCPYKASFITVARQPEYIHATLKSFLESDPLAALLLPVNLLVGGLEAGYVRRYEERGMARVFAMTPEEVEAMESFDALPAYATRGNYRFNTNYLRGLRTNVGLREPLFLFEDDIRFTRDWFRKFMTSLAEITAREPESPIITLYSAIDYPPERGCHAILTKFFARTQGIYYPPESRGRLTAYFSKFGIETYVKAGDILVRDYCIGAGKSIFVTPHSLVQHEGAVSTGFSDGRHRSPTFLP